MRRGTGRGIPTVHPHESIEGINFRIVLGAVSVTSAQRPREEMRAPSQVRRFLDLGTELRQSIPSVSSRHIGRILDGTYAVHAKVVPPYFTAWSAF
jgi:hypothetical protein